MFRRFVIAVLIFLIAVVVAADRVGAIVGAHVLAGKVKTDEHLPNRPSASIGGFPFLTQAFGGDYKDVKITAHNVPVNGLNVTTLTAHLHGVHLGLGKVLGGSVSQLPVDRVDGTAFVSYADANTYLSHHRLAGDRITLGPGSGDTANVVDRLRLAGKTFSLHGAGTASVSDGVVVVGVTHLRGPPNSVVNRQTLRVALRRLRIAIPLQALPFRLKVTSVTVTSAGLSGSGTVRKVVLGSSGNGGG